MHQRQQALRGGGGNLHQHPKDRRERPTAPEPHPQRTPAETEWGPPGGGPHSPGSAGQLRPTMTVQDADPIFPVALLACFCSPSTEMVQPISCESSP